MAAACSLMPTAAALSPSTLSAAAAAVAVARGRSAAESAQGSAARRASGTYARTIAGAVGSAASRVGTGLHATAPEFVPNGRAFATAVSAAGQGATASTTPLSGEVAVGCLVAYQRERDTHASLALVQGRHGKRGWTALSARGNELSLTQQQVAMVLPGGPYTQADLAAIAVEASAAASDPSLCELAWEVSSSGEAYSVPEMADLLFGGASPAQCAAAHSMLSSDRTYFKQTGRLPPAFQPRSPTAVAAIQTEAAIAREKAKERALFVGAIASVTRARPGTAKPSKAAWAVGPHGAALKAIEALALAYPGSMSAAQAAGNAAAANGLAALQLNTTPDAAAGLLKAIGWWGPHDQLALLRLHVSPDFDARLQEAASALDMSPPADLDAATRRDLTGHHVVTIDDASTTEIDDGLSAEALPDGRWRLWVHIADPSRWVDFSDPLDVEAARRSKSTYLPTGMVPMFPHALAEGPFSLRAGAAPGAAMSLGVLLGPDGGIKDYVVTPSLVAPAERLTYHQADARLDDGNLAQKDAAFHALAEAAELRRGWRAARGAVDIMTPEAQVRVRLREGGGAPEVDVVAENTWDSASRLLVAEMMILAGEVIGDLGTKAGLPLPYRGQAAPVLPSEAEMAALPPGLCRAVALRNRMTRSVTTVAAGAPHAALGLPAYVQFTSPIRRYTDLLAHYQVKAHLRGEAPPLSAQQLELVLDAANLATRELIGAERVAENYWLSHYFAGGACGGAWPGTLVCWARQETGMAKVILDIGVEAGVRINRPAALGEQVLLSVLSADPAAGTWQLSEAVPPPPPPRMMPIHPFASTNIPMSPMIHTEF